MITAPNDRIDPASQSAIMSAYRASQLVHSHVKVEVSPNLTTPFTEINITHARISIDGSSSPSLSGEIGISGALPAALTNPAAALPYIRIVAGVTIGNTVIAEQLAIGIILEVTDNNGAYTARFASDEVLLDRAVISPTVPESACPQLTTIGAIWGNIAPRVPIRPPLTITDAASIPTERRSDVWATPYGPGDNSADYLRGLADIAGLWLHSDQNPSSIGGLISETAPTIDPATALDLRTPDQLLASSLVIEQTIKTGIESGYAAAVLLACEWTENGSAMRSVGLIPASAATNRAPVVQNVTLQMRPPSGQRSRITPSWGHAQAIADRAAARTWEVSLLTPLLPWIRPGQTILTDKGYGLVRSITSDLTMSTSHITIRPA